MAQLAEHVIGNDEVPGPNPGSSSKKSSFLGTGIFLLYSKIGTFDFAYAFT